MSEALAGTNVVLTGASRGLGRDLARNMWQQGANLLLVARSNSGLLELKSELLNDARPTQNAHIVVADLAREDSVPAIVEQARRVWNRVDVLVNNAAILGPVGRVWENDWVEWQATLRVNLLAAVELCRALVPWMVECGGGKIVNVSGGGATASRPHFSAYATAKAGLVRFSETLAEEVKSSNISVNCVAPGAMNTAMMQATVSAGPEKAGTREHSRALELMKNDQRPAVEAIELCIFLASSASDGITGRLISAVWDPWRDLPQRAEELATTDIYTLRRIVPHDRGRNWQ